MNTSTTPAETTPAETTPAETTIPETVTPETVTPEAVAGTDSAAVVGQQPRSRMSDPAVLVPELQELSGWLYRATGNRSVPRTTIGLVHLRAGQIVGSTYLTALQTGLLRKAGETDERIDAVATWA
ncbi:carboxymuconolactone decarboxylase family protein, partial [Kitasatospora camelliae]|uniref:carboxymuconolactone decarboxylase family protein n=1 Tax=Kitasatospora camelliae TaxID=3156397 RepID=UPI00339BAD68